MTMLQKGNRVRVTMETTRRVTSSIGQVTGHMTREGIVDEVDEWSATIVFSSAFGDFMSVDPDGRHHLITALEVIS